MISLVNLVAALLAIVMLPSATARLTRLITRDAIAAPLRMWVYRKFGEKSFMAELIGCHWCVGVWASMATCTFAWTLVGVMRVWPPAETVGLALLSIPAVAYHASRQIDREDA